MIRRPSGKIEIREGELHFEAEGREHKPFHARCASISIFKQPDGYRVSIFKTGGKVNKEIEVSALEIPEVDWKPRFSRRRKNAKTYETEDFHLNFFED